MAKGGTMRRLVLLAVVIGLALAVSLPALASVAADIDIKPGSDPNGVNVRGNGLIPVAILTTADFDATTVDPSAVTFGPSGASPAHEGRHVEDADGDGDLDLVVHFRTQETGIACDDTDATLQGETRDGTAIYGTDAIKTSDCRR